VTRSETAYLVLANKVKQSRIAGGTGLLHYVGNDAAPDSGLLHFVGKDAAQNTILNAISPSANAGNTI
jgi:hypothetical protein